MLQGDLNKAFGNRLQQLRQSAGLTQEELAFRADIHRTHVSLLERGLKSPTLQTLFRLCKALGVEPGEVVGSLSAHQGKITHADGSHPPSNA